MKRRFAMVVYSVYALSANYATNFRRDFVKSFAHEEDANFYVRVCEKLDERHGHPKLTYKVDAQYLFDRSDIEDLYPEFKEL
jgi:hypothetical protein